MRTGRRFRAGTRPLDLWNEAGESLLALDRRIYLTEAEEEIRCDTFSGKRAGYPGQSLRPLRRRLDILLTFFLKEDRPEERSELAGRIQAYFTPGIYRGSWRRNQRVHVDLSEVTALPAMLHWTRSFQLRLVACALPWWEEAEPLRVTGEMRSGSLTLAPGGHTERVGLEMLVTNLASMDMNVLEVETGCEGSRLSFMAFHDLQLRAGETLSMLYDREHILRMRCGTRSAFLLRTPASSDELLAVSGKVNQVYVDAGNRVQVEVMARGLMT